MLRCHPVFRLLCFFLNILNAPASICGCPRIGPILTSFGPKLPFLVTLVPASVVVVPVLRGFMQERQLSWQEVQAARAAILRQKEACILCFLMLLATVVLSFFGTMLRDVRANAIASIVIAVLILLSFSILLRPEIAKVNTFFVLQTSVNFSVGGAAFYFYTDTKEQYPEGPCLKTLKSVNHDENLSKPSERICEIL